MSCAANRDALGKVSDISAPKLARKGGPHFSPFLVWKKLAAHRDLHPVTGWVFHFVDIHGEVDGAHDAIAELLLDHILEWQAVHLHDLVEAVDQGVGWDYWVEATLHRRCHQLSLEARIET